MQANTSVFGQANAWLREIISLFLKVPGKWMLLGVAHVFFFTMLPTLLGLQFLALLVQPIFVALVMGFFRNADQGVYADLGDLLNEIKPYFRKLLLLGAISVLYFYLVHPFITGELAQLQQEFANAEPSSEQMMEKVGPLFIKRMLLSLPLVLLIWFTPMLVAFHQYPVWKAIKSSLAAYIQYLVPLLLTWLGVTLIMMLSMTLCGVVVALISVLSMDVAKLLMLVLLFGGILLASALLFTFQYISSRDIFRMPPAAVRELL